VSENNCKGAIRTNRNGAYWDTCDPDKMKELEGSSSSSSSPSSEVMNDEMSGEPTFHGCHCQPNWEYGGKKMAGCAWTEDSKEPWCYISDGAQCGDAQVGTNGKYYDKCRVGPETVKGCHCKGNWDYKGKTMYGCAKTPDAKLPWCYISDTDRCASAKDGEDGKWDECKMEGELTTHECHCEPTWEYQGKTYENCQSTVDSKTRWCYVSDPKYCEGAQTDAKGRKYDTCPVIGEETINGCHCKQKWTYAEQEFSNCVQTPDSGDTAWCMVTEGKACQDGQLSEETGEIWDECDLGVVTQHGCHCNKHWKYGGLWHKGCIMSKDTGHPWCYVSDFKTCKGAVKTNKGGKYWDVCYDDAETSGTFALLQFNETGLFQIDESDIDIE